MDMTKEEFLVLLKDPDIKKAICEIVIDSAMRDPSFGKKIYTGLDVVINCVHGRESTR